MKKILYILSIVFTAAMVASCSQDIDIDSNKGYLSLDINTLTSTHEPTSSRAAVPEGYNPKTLHIEIQDKDGKVVKSTDDFASDDEFKDKFLLLAGKYTVVAHSANWDGKASGFDVPYYYGSSTVQVKPKGLVTASLTCTQANVKITVNYDESISENFNYANTTVSSALVGINSLEFKMGKTTQSGYIPVGDFDVILDLINKKGDKKALTQSFTDVKARDHYILNFKLQETGNLGDGNGPGIKVEVDETTNTYTYTFEVPRKSAITLVTRAANAWSNFAMLNASVTAKTDAFKNTGLTIQWKKSTDSEWSEIENSELTIDGNDNVTTTLKRLSPNTNYEYRLRYVDGDNEIVCDPVTFKTEEQLALYNGGFENWHQNGRPWYPNASGVTYWDTSNPGSTKASAKANVTTPESDKKRSGTYAAKLESRVIAAIAFAAASMYTGQFQSVDITTQAAKLKWGVPFNTRPTALKGYMQYIPKAIDNVGTNLPNGAPGKGSSDQCGMYCALLTEPLTVDNGDMNTFPNWENDSRVIAYGTLPTDKSGKTPDGQWTEVNIPLVYRDLTRKPTHLLVVFSASKYGDYFHGGEGSTLYLDDFELVYGDTPSVK